MSRAAGKVLSVLTLLGLAACNGGPATETLIAARQQAIDPPQLWRLEVMGGAGAVRSAVYVCADTPLREAFARTRAEVNGKPCQDTTSPLVKPNGWVLRCVVDGRPFAVSSTTTGDLERDFRLNFGLTQLYYYPTPNDPAPTTVRQSRHFLYMGACPAGWRIGDQAKPGRRPHPA
ncbi:hypothetical protein [Phenylobacterium sp.]|uniref:hypothetical protein n=1 Tax=Phenylobacterium sp. TaxID=1871053 RepID=UPI003567EC77